VHSEAARNPENIQDRRENEKTPTVDVQGIHFPKDVQGIHFRTESQAETQQSKTTSRQAGSSFTIFLNKHSYQQ
jgi:hypothetical protein